jgi:hypothetical protein
MKVCKTLIRRFDSDPRLHSKHSQLPTESVTYREGTDFTGSNHFHCFFTASNCPRRQKSGKDRIPVRLAAPLHGHLSSKGWAA